eukprot:jgi/Mesvir1/11096/Mv02466-RA.1
MSMPRGRLVTLIAVVLAAAIGNSSAAVPAAAGGCTDDSVDGVDTGCYPDYPFCYQDTPRSAAQQGDGGGPFDFCAVCLDSAAGNATDYGCNPLTPICYDQQHDTSDGDFNEGVNCTACIDSADGAGVDLGCENGDSLFSAFSAREYKDGYICYTGSDSTASLMEGQSILSPVDLPLSNCAVCLDSAVGTNVDVGCSSVKPYCFDIPLFPDEFYKFVDLVNDGDNGFGLYCSDCYDSVAVGIDEGCSIEKPVCIPPYPIPFVPNLRGMVGIGCAECLPYPIDPFGNIPIVRLAAAGCTADKPLCVSTRFSLGLAEFPFAAAILKSEPRCFACENNYTLAIQGETLPPPDYGCSERRPFCADLLFPTTLTGVEDTGFGSFCGECIDNLPQLDYTTQFNPDTITEIDMFCNNTHPFCIDLDPAPGSQDFGLCNTLNPVCEFLESADGLVASVPAACVKETVVLVSTIIALDQCTSAYLDLLPILNAISSGFLPFIPRCAIGGSVQYYGARRRQLLQQLDPQQFLLEVKSLTSTA